MAKRNRKTDKCIAELMVYYGTGNHRIYGDRAYWNKQYKAHILKELSLLTLAKSKSEKAEILCEMIDSTLRAYNIMPDDKCMYADDRIEGLVWRFSAAISFDSAGTPHIELDHKEFCLKGLYDFIYSCVYALQAMRFNAYEKVIEYSKRGGLDVAN